MGMRERILERELERAREMYAEASDALFAERLEPARLQTRVDELEGGAGMSDEKREHWAAWARRVWHPYRGKGPNNENVCVIAFPTEADRDAALRDLEPYEPTCEVDRAKARDLALYSESMTDWGKRNLARSFLLEADARREAESECERLREALADAKELVRTAPTLVMPGAELDPWHRARRELLSKGATSDG